MLNDRLLACAEYVQGDVVCDVGTDHAQLLVYLLQKNLIQKAIACDIKEKPLQAARKNISQAGQQERTEFFLSDGLQNVPEKNITDIVIAGMGGEMIVHILENSSFSLENKTLIFQPMSKAEILRKWLYLHGFEIMQEKCIPDKQFLYAVMQVKKTNISRNPEIEEIYFGKMNLHFPESEAYAKRVIQQLKKANFHETAERSAIIQQLERKLHENSKRNLSGN